MVPVVRFSARSVSISILFVVFVLLSDPAHGDRFNCDLSGTRGMPEDCNPDDNTYVETDSFTLVHPSVFAGNPIFNDHFDVYVCWDYQAAGSNPEDPWDEADLREFADSIINPVYGDERGRAKSILDYFGEDVDPSPTHFAIRTTDPSDSNDDITYTRFKIFILDTARHISADDDWMTAHIDNGGGPVKRPWEVACDAFNHEWQHVCHQSWKRSTRQSRAFQSFNEMCAVLSVSMFGVEDTGGHTMSYDNTILGSSNHSFASNCLNAVPVDDSGDPGSSVECTTKFGLPYNDWAMFSLYLNNSYSIGTSPVDDLIYRWIRRHSSAASDTTYHHDIVGLGEVLYHANLDDFFSFGANPHQRSKEVFRSYAIAKFLNRQSGPDVPQYQWMADGADPDGYRPQELYNFLRDTNGSCYDNIRSSPLYHVVTPERQEFSGWQFSVDHFDPCEDDSVYSGYRPEWVRRRMVGVETFASNYIVLLPPVEDDKRVSFSLRFLDRYECLECYEFDPPFTETLKQSSFEGETELIVDFISYDLPLGTTLEPGGTSGLDYYGEYASDIESHWLEPGESEIVNLSLDAFDNGADAVAVVMSLVAKEEQENTPGLDLLPYEYRFMALPDTASFVPGPIFGNVTLAAGGSYWVTGDLEVLPTGSLTVEEGATVYFCGEDAKITVNGGTLIVAGSASSPVEFQASNLPEYLNTIYEGLFVENDGSIQVEYALITGAVQIAGGVGDVSFSNSRLRMADDDDNGILLDNHTNPIYLPVLADVVLDDVNRIRLNSSYSTAVIEGSTITQREELQSVMSVPFPLVTTTRGNLMISSSELHYLRTGVQVGEKFFPHEPIANLGPDLLIQPLPTSTNPTTGLVTTGKGRSVLDDCLIRRCERGVKTLGEAELYMGSSAIHEADYGIVNYAKNGSVTIGDYLGSNFIAPSSEHADCWSKVSGSPCELEPDSVKMVRVYNATPSTVFAAQNKWGTCDSLQYGIDCMCPSAFFKPNPQTVDYSGWVAQSLGACREWGDPQFFGGVETRPQNPLEGAWPNPFNGQVQFLYRADGAMATLRIYDISGREVRQLGGVLSESGDRSFVWNGYTNTGKEASSGVYLYRIDGGPDILKGKVIYVK